MAEQESRKLEELVEWNSSIEAGSAVHTDVMRLLYALFVPVIGTYPDITVGDYKKPGIRPLSKDPDSAWAQFDGNRMYYAAQISIPEIGEIFQRLKTPGLTGIAQVDSPMVYFIDNSDKEVPNTVFILRASDLLEGSSELAYKIQADRVREDTRKFSKIRQELPQVIGEPPVKVRYPVLIAAKKQEEIDYLIEPGDKTPEGADFKGSMISSLNEIYTKTNTLVSLLNSNYARFDRAHPFHQALSPDINISLRGLSESLAHFGELAASDDFDSLDLEGITEEAEAMHKDMPNFSKREKYVSIATSVLLRSLKAAKMHGIKDQAVLDQMALAAYLSVTSLLIDLHDRNEKIVAEEYLGHSAAILGKSDTFSREAIELIKLMHISNAGSSVYPIRRNTQTEGKGAPKDQNALTAFNVKYADRSLIAARQILYGTNIVAKHIYKFKGSDHENFAPQDSIDWLAEYKAVSREVLSSISLAWSLSVPDNKPMHGPEEGEMDASPTTKSELPEDTRLLLHNLLHNPSALLDGTYLRVGLRDNVDPDVYIHRRVMDGLGSKSVPEKLRREEVSHKILEGRLWTAKSGRRYVFMLDREELVVYGYNFFPNGRFDYRVYKVLDIRPPAEEG